MEETPPDKIDEIELQTLGENASFPRKGATTTKCVFVSPLYMIN